jgi:hypothetical protein
VLNDTVSTLLTNGLCPRPLHMLRAFSLGALLGAVVLTAACKSDDDDVSTTTGGDDTGAACITKDECLADQICVDGFCKPGSTDTGSTGDDDDTGTNTGDDDTTGTDTDGPANCPTNAVATAAGFCTCKVGYDTKYVNGDLSCIPSVGDPVCPKDDKVCWFDGQCLTLSEFSDYDQLKDGETVIKPKCDSGAVVEDAATALCGCRPAGFCDGRRDCVDTSSGEAVCVPVKDYKGCADETTVPKRDENADCTCTRKPCNNETFPCCPGYSCNVASQCVPSFTVCTDDAACKTPGQVCRPLSFVDGNSYCTYPATDDKGECPAGRRPWEDICIGATNLPCNGGCTATQVCELLSNKCIPAPTSAASTDCDVSCGAGEIKIFKNPESALNDIAFCPDTSCECRTKPSLLAGDISLYNDIVFTGGKVYGTAYNQTYGDLNFVEFDANGKFAKIEYVDGVPAAGAKLDGDPAGPRGGVAAAGPDVGQFTSVAAGSDGTFHVSYYDVANKALKYARRAAAGTWTSFTVDASGDCGTWTSLELSATGTPIVAYRCNEVVTDEANNVRATQLRVAEATSGAPAAGTDFVPVVVDSADLIAEVEGTPNIGFKQGTGYMASLVIAEGTRPIVAFYDNRLTSAAATTYLGDLKVARRNDDGSYQIVTVAGAGSDAGRFPSLAIDEANNLGISFQDATSRSLQYVKSTGLDVTTFGAAILVDAAVFQADNRKGQPGADTALVFNDVNPRIAYFEGTGIDLLWSTSSDAGATWAAPQVLNGQQVSGVGSGCGFFNRVAKSGPATAFVGDVCLGWAKNPDGTYNAKQPANVWTVRQKAL